MVYCDVCGDGFDPVEWTVVREGGPVFCSWDCEAKAESVRDAYELG